MSKTVDLVPMMMEQYIKGKLSEASEARARDFQSRHIAYGKTNR